jgi:anthranilate/para-aminobenzoate synthase component II
LYPLTIVTLQAVPASLRVTAKAAHSGGVVAVQHRTLPYYAVQFHPEVDLSVEGV